MERDVHDSMLCACYWTARVGCQGLGLDMIGIGRRLIRTVWWVRQGLPGDSYCAVFPPVPHFPATC